MDGRVNNKGKKGNKGGRRGGYEFEKAQLDKMRKLVGMDLNVVEKIYKGTATDADFKKLVALQTRVSKYLDKLHATKEKSEMDVKGNINFEWKQ